MLNSSAFSHSISVSLFLSRLAFAGCVRGDCESSVHFLELGVAELSRQSARIGQYLGQEALALVLEAFLARRLHRRVELAHLELIAGELELVGVHKARVGEHLRVARSLELAQDARCLGVFVDAAATAVVIGAAGGAARRSPLLELFLVDALKA